MKLLKNKKSEEGTGMIGKEIIGWIIVGALIVFALVWYSGIGTKIIEIFKSALK